jgi:UDP-N-acetylglucosamine:LPS N-acetylglucosamine transferase
MAGSVTRNSVAPVPAPVTEQWPRRVLFVCSSGGHLAQLHRLEPWWRSRERRWVTFDTDDARSLLADEDLVPAYCPTTRNIPNLLRNLILAFVELHRWRPDVIVSDGAAVAVPFFVAGALLRIPRVYLEVIDRLETPTLTGRLCAPFTDLFLVQDERQRTLYPGSTTIGRLM